MKRNLSATRSGILLPLLVSALAAAPSAATAATPSETPAAGATSPPSAFNPMHPAVAVLDEAGNAVAATHRPPSVMATCGACHDASYINAHSDHWNERVRATCVQCHFQGGELPRDPAAYDAAGRLRREAIRISAPRDENCAACHGIVHPGPDPVSVPPEYGPAVAGDSLRAFDLTLQTGAIFSGQNLSASFLNLQGKTGLDFPWDAHARRLVHCVDCHFASNNPAKGDEKKERLEFVVDDPRRIPLSQFLHQPDHRLQTASCRSCHDPLKTHQFLPYKERHFQALACPACHVPHPMGPAVRAIDATVVTLERRPGVEYRGLDAAPGRAMNAILGGGYTPLLLPQRGDDGVTRLAPFNAVDTWFWADGPQGSRVDPAMVARAFLRGPDYAPEVLAAFDADHDGTLSAAELRLDSPAKHDLIRARLQSLGVKDPRIRREVAFHRLEHGVQAGGQVQRDCGRCHQKDSRLGAGLALASYTPNGAEPTAGASLLDPRLGATLRPGSDGDRVAAAGAGGFYILGHTRRGWGDRLGLLLFAVVLLGVAAHALFRLLSRRAREERRRAPLRRVYLYSAYERIWHWLMMFCILTLMYTGLQIHFFADGALLSLPTAVRWHNLFAVILTVNAFLSLFYHLTTSTIRQFLPGRRDLLDRVAAQAHYYTRGIFLGQPHPSPKTPERKMNPLQQLTYLALLNVLFPLQVITGVLIWGVSRWPHMAQAIGGLTVVAPLHSLGSWFFLAFALLHVYLTTTGHTVVSNIAAMVSGFEEIEVAASAASGGSHV